MKRLWLILFVLPLFAQENPCENEEYLKLKKEIDSKGVLEDTKEFEVYWAYYKSCGDYKQIQENKKLDGWFNERIQVAYSDKPCKNPEYLKLNKKGVIHLNREEFEKYSRLSIACDDWWFKDRQEKRRIVDQEARLKSIQQQLRIAEQKHDNEDLGGDILLLLINRTVKMLDSGMIEREKYMSFLEDRMESYRKQHNSNLTIRSLKFLNQGIGKTFQEPDGSIWKIERGTHVSQSSVYRVEENYGSITFYDENGFELLFARRQSN